MPTTSTDDIANRMQCMEVWGGNQPIERQFTMPGLDVWISSRPCGDSSAGGDVYYLSSCASGRISRLLLADVSGHGESVSRVGLSLRDLMRNNVKMVRQNRFVSAMNQEFSAVAANDVFATAVVFTFFSPKQSLVLCNAGHPKPLLYSARRDAWHPLDLDARHQADNTPLGLIEAADYGQVATRLATGDMLLAYTDGVTETEVSGGGLLGTVGLLDLVRGLDSNQPERLLDELLAVLRGKAARSETCDDVSLVLSRANGTGVPWRNNLMALGRLFRGVRDATHWRSRSA